MKEKFKSILYIAILFLLFRPTTIPYGEFSKGLDIVIILLELVLIIDLIIKKKIKIDLFSVLLFLSSVWIFIISMARGRIITLWLIKWFVTLFATYQICISCDFTHHI